MENCTGEKIDSLVNQNGIQKDETSEDTTLLREPQVVLTRLESFSSEALVDGGDLTSSEEAPGARTDEEAMDTGVAPLDLAATKLQEDHENEISEVINSSGTVDVVDQMNQLEHVLSSSAEEGDLQETPPQDDGTCDPPQEGSLGEAEAVGETAVSEVIEPAQAEEIFIQTAEGLVRQSAEELASKGIVIVNGPDGTTMHIEAPEGVPLETVHALLGIETERKT